MTSRRASSRPKTLLGGFSQGLDLFFVFRGRVGGRAVENARLDRVVADAGILENPLQHEPVEGDLEAVFDLDLHRGLHVADEDVQGAVRVAFQPQEVHVATQQPAGEFGFQAGLEQEDRLAGEQLAGFSERPRCCSRGRLWDLPYLIGVVDGAEALGEVGLDAFLEGVARQRQQGRDPLRDHVVLLHELLPGPFRQPEAKESFALLQADELRYVRGRQPLWVVWWEDRQ